MKIKSKFVDKLLVPANGIMRGEVETSDGVRCMAEFRTTWDNADGFCDEELEAISQREYGCPFSAIRSIWIGRLGNVSDIWHLVKLIKL
jgi:hypothetical protein